MVAQSDIDERIIDEAIAWHVALESEDADWHAYTVWLEGDPRHRIASDQIALTEDAIERNRHRLNAIHSVKPVERTKSFGKRPLILSAMAAAVALLVGVPMLLTHEASQTFQTTVGESRTIALGDGSRVILAPASTLVASGANMAHLELASGAAFFDVRHDPARSLTVLVNDYRINDIGTKFAVDLGDGNLRVAVSEGQVAFASKKSAGKIAIPTGYQLTVGQDDASPRLGRIAAKDVASWRQGRLVYDNVPIGLVVADVSRYSGQRVIVDPSLQDRHFSGVLVIGDGSQLLANLSGFMAFKMHDEGNAVRISAADR